MKDLTKEQLIAEMCRRMEADWALQQEIAHYASIAWDVMHDIPEQRCKSCVFFWKDMEAFVCGDSEGYCMSEDSPHKKVLAGNGKTCVWYMLDERNKSVTDNDR